MNQKGRDQSRPFSVKTVQKSDRPAPKKGRQASQCSYQQQLTRGGKRHSTTRVDHDTIIMFEHKMPRSYRALP